MAKLARPPGRAPGDAGQAQIWPVASAWVTVTPRCIAVESSASGPLIILGL